MNKERIFKRIFEPEKVNIVKDEIKGFTIMVVNDVEFADLQHENEQLKDYCEIIKEIHKSDNAFSQKLCDVLRERLKQSEEREKIKDLALELASEKRDDWGGCEYDDREYNNYYDYFLDQAKKKLEERK